VQFSLNNNEWTTSNKNIKIKKPKNEDKIIDYSYHIDKTINYSLENNIIENKAMVKVEEMDDITKLYKNNDINPIQSNKIILNNFNTDNCQTSSPNFPQMSHDHVSMCDSLIETPMIKDLVIQLKNGKISTEEC